MKNREYVLPGNLKSRDTGEAAEMATALNIEVPPKSSVPLNELPYNGNTVAAKKDSFPVNGPGYQQNANNQIPADGRKIKGYKPTLYRSDTAIFKESGRMVKRDQALGRVEVKTNHPNTDINKTYG